MATRLEVSNKQYIEQEFSNRKYWVYKDIGDLENDTNTRGDSDKQYIQIKENGYDIVELSIAIQEAGLTSTEKMIVGLLVYGLKHKEIASKLGLTQMQFRYSHRQLKAKLKKVL